MLDAQYFMPHGHCYLWRPDILWTHVISDAITGIAYFSIPLAIAYYRWKSRFTGKLMTYVMAMFITFIFLCGTTHFIQIWTVWKPNYYFEGFVKALTAVASVLTAVSIWPLIPKALRIPSPEELEKANSELDSLNRSLEKTVTDAVATSEQKATALEVTNKKLEVFNKITAGRENQMIELKGEVNQLLERLGEKKKYQILGK